MNKVTLPAWVLKFFQKVTAEVPAYRAHLLAHTVRPSHIRTTEDFVRKVPFTEKKNYIIRYTEQGRLLPSERWRPLYASSGSSGSPTFWRLGEASAQYGYEVHEELFKKGFVITPSESTLLIVCFGMGIWIAGTFTAQVGNYLSDKGWSIATATPGLDEPALVALLTHTAPKFHNVILAGFPTYIGRMVRTHRNLVEQSKARFKILLAAEQISEEFRDQILSDIQSSRSADVLSVYGSADAGVMGFETPTTIALRRASALDRGLEYQLFGSSGSTTLPALYQYNPKHVYFEQMGRELALTARTASPLIRYNIHDVGEVINTTSLAAALKRIHNPAGPTFLRYPAVTYRSRTDVALLYHAINMTAAQLGAWYVPRYHDFILGFFAYTKKNNTGLGEQLYFRLCTTRILNNTAQRALAKTITKTLIMGSTEFRKIYDTFGHRALPKFRFVHKTSDLQKPTTQHGLLHLSGKKARVV